MCINTGRDDQPLTDGTTPFSLLSQHLVMGCRVHGDGIASSYIGGAGGKGWGEREGGGGRERSKVLDRTNKAVSSTTCVVYVCVCMYNTHTLLCAHVHT